MLRVGGEDSVEADHVLPRLGDRGGESAQELDWLQQDVGLPRVEGLAQLEPHPAVLQLGQALLGEGRAQAVAQQALELFALISVYGQICV